MGLKQFISESEACNIAGVSRTTLSRFAEAGYLEVETESDGLLLYAKDDIASVFGITEGMLARKPEPIQETRQEPTKVTATQKSEAEKSGSIIHFPKSPPAEAPTVEAVKVEEEVEVPEFLKTETPPVRSEEKAPVVEEEAVKVDEVVASTSKAETVEKVVQTEALLALENDNRRLENIVDIQEKILDMKDGQLEELRKERDWLRSRVEKLEEKSDRDQLLILSETQLLRQMITRESRSPMRTMLEWVGIVSPDPHPTVVEHKK